MLIRIVRMTFKEENAEKFLKIFKDSKSKIRNFSGCTHLELMKDYHQENIFITYSLWENEKCLNEYRNSELFKEVWKNTKKLFSEKSVAFSLRKTDF